MCVGLLWLLYSVQTRLDFLLISMYLPGIEFPDNFSNIPFHALSCICVFMCISQ